jgi:hypothetical protein
MQWKRRVETFGKNHPKVVGAFLLAFGIAIIAAVTVGGIRQLRAPIDGHIVSLSIVGARLPQCSVRISTSSAVQRIVLDPDACVSLRPGLHVTKGGWSSTIRVGQSSLPSVPWLGSFIAALSGCVLLVIGALLSAAQPAVAAYGASPRR